MFNKKLEVEEVVLDGNVGQIFKLILTIPVTIVNLLTSFSQNTFQTQVGYFKEKEVLLKFDSCLNFWNN